MAGGVAVEACRELGIRVRADGEGGNRDGVCEVNQAFECLAEIQRPGLILEEQSPVGDRLAVFAIDDFAGLVVEHEGDGLEAAPLLGLRLERGRP